VSADVLELELDPDPGWYPVPEYEDEVDTWAAWLVRELAGPDAGEDDVGTVVEDVRAHARRAHELQVELAFVFLPDPLGPVLASCHVELVFGTAGDLPDQAEIAAALSQRRPEHVDVPEVGRVLLTAGPAVRQRVMGAEDDGVVVESVTHVVTVPGMDDALVRTTTSWWALGLGEALTERADRMAAALVVRTS
jgi:hypothetical protein